LFLVEHSLTLDIFIQSVVNIVNVDWPDFLIELPQLIFRISVEIWDVYIDPNNRKKIERSVREYAPQAEQGREIKKKIKLTCKNEHKLMNPTYL